MKKFLIIFLLLIFPIPAFADTVDIYCPKCHRFLVSLEYHSPLTLDYLKVENIVKEGDFKFFNGQRFICPFDDTPLNGWEYWAWEKNFPQPVMAYPALTVMTMNDKGEFVWFPHEVDISDN